MKKPNIIFYFSDQQRPDTMGCYGQSLPVTPHLDKLAEEGTLFENAFTPQPVCGPARACLQSGKFATQVNCHRNALALPEDITTVADLFNEAGYDTCYVGKWHLASNRASYTAPFDEENYEVRAIPEERMGGYRRWIAADVLECTSHGYDGFLFDETGKKHEFIGYRADAVNNYAIHEIHQRDKNKPLFMFISQIEPHHQNDHGRFEGPDGSKERFGTFTPPADLKKGEGDWEVNYPDYLGQCHSLDENVGRLVDTLKDMGMWDDTILFYASDHGSHFRTRNSEYKRSCHEASIHVPLIAVGGVFSGKGRVSELVSLMDIPATLLALAGIEKPEDYQGRSLTDLVDGKGTDWETSVYVQISEAEVGRCVRSERWKYAVRADKDAWEDASAEEYTEAFLYDLKEDPQEHRNLAADPAYLAVREEMKKQLLCWMKRAGESIPVILPAK